MLALEMQYHRIICYVLSAEASASGRRTAKISAALHLSGGRGLVTVIVTDVDLRCLE